MLRRTPMKRGKGLNPRRKRTGSRMKRGLGPNASEELHMERVGKLPCIVTKRPHLSDGDTVLHHVMKVPGKRCRRDHRFIVPLVPEMHNMGPLSIHELGSEAKFERTHNLPHGFIANEAIRLWAESEELLFA